ncbi:MAG: succinate dehydrogenase assembly factor 2 [Rhodobacteraceae bacterium]|nr:succinate dehydrogenase assembly factor 2 [Paracoccaceae bacterium]
MEADEARRKRARLRAWRRGIKEMDLILGGHADRHLPGMDEARLAAFEALLDEDDHELYVWVSGGGQPPARHGPMIAEIAAELGAGAAAGRA